MFNNRSKLILLTCLLGLLASTVSVDANAKYTKRSDKWEASFKVLNNQFTDIDGQGGSSLSLDSDYGWGGTLGYNVNPHILVNVDFSSSTPSYKTTTIDENGNKNQTNHKMDLLETQFNVVYSVFSSQFTPYVQAGAGWSYIDSNIVSSINEGCWYDWWYGWICQSYANTYDDTRFSYNVAAGFRYELDNSLFFRASYKQAWIDFSNASGASIGSYHLEIGSIF